MAEKQLKCTAIAAQHQKQWFAALRQDVFEGGKPYAIVQADMPLELFQVMGMPVVSNQWWAAMIAAKKMSSKYLDVLNDTGYSPELCRYCSLSLASTLANDPVTAPWGGLPKPAIISARLTCDCIQRVFSTWAAALGVEFVAFDAPGASHLPPRWWELSRDHWEDLFEPERLDYMIAQFKRLIKKLETITGDVFNEGALRALMNGVNQQEEYFEEARTLICNAEKCPVRMNEQMSNVMACQWLRGTDWAISHARSFRDEVQSRVDQGIAACPNEKIRLMWIGAGLWHATEFYTAFEESLGAVFVWSMYLAFGPDGYIRHGLDDPLRALASRTVSMNEQLHNPPWANEWIVNQARRHRIDAAIILTPLGTRPAATGNRFIELALERAGIPALPIVADMVDARKWKDAEMKSLVEKFLRERVRRL